MKFFQANPRRARLSSLLVLGLLSVDLVNGQCQPSTWVLRKRDGDPTGAMPLVRRDVDPPLGVGYDPQPGEINCRARGDTYEDVNYYTCTDLADTFGIHLEFFFFLNPTLLPDCSNIQPNSKYCVAGCKCQESEPKPTAGRVLLPRSLELCRKRF